MVPGVRPLLFAALVAVLLFASGPLSVGAHPEDGDPTRATHWFSLINMSHGDPSDIRVVVVPPAYVSYNAMVRDQDWIGADAVYAHPAVQATLEAIEYWQWAIDQYATEYPSAQSVRIDVRVLGHDADMTQLNTADIIVNTAMVADPIPFLFHAGLGLPTYPTNVLFGGHGEQPMTKCTVWNTGAGTSGAVYEPMRLRNLVVHEFGHCIAAGHTGTSLGASHCSDHHGCFDQHPTDVMSSVAAGHRQCLSNLNIQGLDEAYRPFATTGRWGAHDAETFMKKSDYAVKCLPEALFRF